MAISGRRPRSVPVAVKTVLAPRLVIARSEATWQSREGTPDPYRPPLKRCWPPRLVIARRPEADVAISGRHCRSERATVKPACTPDLSLRGAKRRGNLGKALPFGTGHR